MPRPLSTARRSGQRLLRATLLAPLLCLLALSPLRADPAGRFREGLERFKEARRYAAEHPSERVEAARRYRRAAAAFVAAWREGAMTTQVLTNAANSFHFAGDQGEAVLYYLRALAADPGNERARSALEAIREKLGAGRRRAAAGTLLESLFFWHDPRSFHWRLLGFYLTFPAAWILFTVELARRPWPWSRWLLVLVFPFALMAMLLGYLFQLRRPYAAVGVFCLLPALLFLGTLGADALSRDAVRRAVVLVEVQGRKGDGPSYSPSHTRPFPPGTEVMVLEERGGGSGRWLHVELLDGSRSFVPAGTVERVLPRVEAPPAPGGS